MILRCIIEWLKRKDNDYDRKEKGRLCAPCDTPCGKDLCAKVGCLNMDMRSNSLRLQLLVKRLEESGYQFPVQVPIKTTDEEPVDIPVHTEGNVVQLSDYRKDESAG